MIRCDSAVFDCDGVLVDISESYGAAIATTVSYVLEWLGIPDMPPVPRSVVQAFKDTGGFNNEVDLAYAAILCMAAAHRSGRDPYHTLVSASTCTDIRAVERLLGDDAAPAVKRLEYPNPDNMTSRIFDQIFYGPEMYRQIFGHSSEFAGPGLIERERLIINDSLAATLRERFGGKIAMVTGRGYRSASRTLKHHMELFDYGASSFLERMPRHMAKPNPISLVRAIDTMESRHSIYVGDSAEDLMMAQAIPERVTFVGIYGTSPDPGRRRDLFLRRGVRHTIRSVLDLPKLLNSS